MREPYIVWPKQINPCFGLTFRNDYKNQYDSIQRLNILYSLCRDIEDMLHVCDSYCDSVHSRILGILLYN